jgi:hypothetical protein
LVIALPLSTGQLMVGPGVPAKAHNPGARIL